MKSMPIYIMPGRPIIIAGSTLTEKAGITEKLSLLCYKSNDFAWDRESSTIKHENNGSRGNGNSIFYINGCNYGPVADPIQD